MNLPRKKWLVWMKLNPCYLGYSILNISNRISICTRPRRRNWKISHEAGLTLAWYLSSSTTLEIALLRTGFCNNTIGFLRLGTKRYSRVMDKHDFISSSITRAQLENLGRSGLSTWKYQFSYDHWSQATLSSVSTWMGLCLSVAWVLLLTLKVG